MPIDGISIGITIVAILQGANLAATKQLSNRIDAKVSEKTCVERRTVCDKDQTRREREMRAIERKIGRHVHEEGNGVRFSVGTD